MKEPILILILGLATLLPVQPMRAQIAPPNEEGVSMGHLEFLVQDVEAYRNFFIAMGGAPAAHGTVKFPDVVMQFRKGDPSGGTVGSVVNHFGFQVPDTSAALEKWKAAGLKTEVGQLPGQAFVYTPDSLSRIEILQNKALTVPIVFHHIHFFVADPGPGGGSAIKEIQDWYAKVFGAKPGKRGPFDAADLPGVNLTFSKSDTPTVPTSGRVLDHIGFEISDLEGFCKKESALGIKFDSPCTKTTDKGNFVIYLTDPFGTKIELTNNSSKM